MEIKYLDPTKYYDKFIYVYARKKLEDIPGSGDLNDNGKYHEYSVDFSGEIQKNSLSTYLSRPNVKVDFRPPRIILSKSDRSVDFREMNKKREEIFYSGIW